MRAELWILVVTAGAVWTTYYSFDYMRVFVKYRKHFQAAFIVFIALMACVILRYNPKQGKNMIACANNSMKFLPINRTTSDAISHILDISGGQQSFMSQLNGNANPGHVAASHEPPVVECGGEQRHKRSVSGMMKKKVAASQSWKCNSCGSIFSESFEVHHRVSLHMGGSNSFENLVALCRECHGHETANERLYL